MMHTQSECPLFKLPPEVRNEIWALTFTTHPTVDLLDACPPSKDLVSTCRRIHKEIAPMHKQAFRAYWSDTTFIVDAFQGARIPREKTTGDEPLRALDKDKQGEVYRKIQELRNEDLAHIKHLCVHTQQHSEVYEFGLPNVDTWTHWHAISNVPGSSHAMLFAPVEKKAALEDAGLETCAFCGSRKYVLCMDYRWEAKDWKAARRIIDWSGLAKEELMCILRVVCGDRPRWR